MEDVKGAGLLGDSVFDNNYIISCKLQIDIGIVFHWKNPSNNEQDNNLAVVFQVYPNTIHKTMCVKWCYLSLFYID